MIQTLRLRVLWLAAKGLEIPDVKALHMAYLFGSWVWRNRDLDETARWARAFERAERRSA
jgi:hypothetical protein